MDPDKAAPFPEAMASTHKEETNADTSCATYASAKRQVQSIKAMEQDDIIILVFYPPFLPVGDEDSPKASTGFQSLLTYDGARLKWLLDGTVNYTSCRSLPGFGPAMVPEEEGSHGSNNVKQSKAS